MTISKSEDRFTFQLKSYLKRKLEDTGKTPENDADVQAMVEYYQNEKERAEQIVNDPSWQQDNLEYDLRSTDWLLEKARADKTYAQAIYAALCNNEFTKLEVVPILTGKKWSCSWRYAGGIVADMLQNGDYIDWYCSGIRTDNSTVPEGCITSVILEDFKKLGWFPVNGGDWELFV